MGVTYRATGTGSTATAAVTAVSATVPATHAAGDRAVLAVFVKPYSATITTPAGWTKIGEHTNGTVASGTDTGSTKVAVYYHDSIAASTVVGPITQSGADSMGAQIVSYQKGASQSWIAPTFTTGEFTLSGSDSIATGAVNLNIIGAAGEALLGLGTHNGDNDAPTLMQIGAAGCTGSGSNSRDQVGVSTGNDIRRLFTDILFTTGASSAAPVMTAFGTINTGAAMFVRMRASASWAITATTPVTSAVVASIRAPQPLTATVPVTSAVALREDLKTQRVWLTWGGFESGESGLSVGWGPDVGNIIEVNATGTRSHTGLRAINLYQDSSATDPTTATNVLTGFIPGYVYTFSAWARSWNNDTGGTVRIGVVGIGDSGLVPSTSSTIDTFVSYTFTATATTHTLTIERDSTLVGSDGMWDDMSVSHLYNPVAATVTVVSGVTANIGVSTPSSSWPITATVPVLSAVSAAITSRLPLSATTAVVSAVSAVIAKITGLSATTAVVSAVSAAITSRLPLAASIPVVSAVSAAITKRTSLSATTPAVSAVSANIGSYTPSTSYPLTATTPVTSAVVASLGQILTLTATVPVVSGVSASITKSTALAATTPVVSAVSASLTVQKPLTALTPVLSTSSASIALRAPLQATTPVVSTVTAQIGKPYALTATTVVVSTVTANIQIAGGANPLNATVNVISSVSASIVLRSPLTATTPVLSTVTAAITTRKPLTATTPIVSTISASIATRKPLTATTVVISTVIATLALRRMLTAVTPIVSTVVANIDLQPPPPTTGESGTVTGPSHDADVSYGISNDSVVGVGDWASTVRTGRSGAVVSRPGRQT